MSDRAAAPLQCSRGDGIKRRQRARSPSRRETVPTEGHAGRGGACGLVAERVVEEVEQQLVEYLQPLGGAVRGGEGP